MTKDEIIHMKTVIFDFDGTIVDNFEVMLSIFNRLALYYAKRDLTDLTHEEIRKKTARQIISYIGIPFWRIPRAISALRTEFYKIVDDVKAFEKIPDVLSELKKTYRLGIVTTNSVENVKQILKNNKIDCFDFISEKSKLFGKDKHLSKILKNKRLNKKNVIYIGDEIRDIDAAHKIGIPIISVTWGYNDKTELIKNNPDFLAENPSDIIKIVENNF